MKTKREAKQVKAVRTAGRAYKCGLTNVLGEPHPHMSRKAVRELTQFFREDSVCYEPECEILFNQKYF
jgi:hypothetical protein